MSEKECATCQYDGEFMHKKCAGCFSIALDEYQNWDPKIEEIPLCYDSVDNNTEPNNCM